MLLYIIILLGVGVFGGLVYALRGTGQKPTHAGSIVYKNEGGQTLYLIVTSSSNKNKWVLPKGKIEKGEAPSFAAVREVTEEAGVQAKIIKKAGTIKYEKRGQKITAVYYLMQFAALHNKPGEDRNTEWVTKEDAIARIQRPGIAKLLGKL